MFDNRETVRTAVYGPVCTVVWEGWSREASPYPDCAEHDREATVGTHGQSIGSDIRSWLVLLARMVGWRPSTCQVLCRASLRPQPIDDE